VSLKECIVSIYLLNEDVEVSLWDYIGTFAENEDDSEPIPMVDSKSILSLRKAIEICKNTEQILRQCAEPVGFFNNVYHWIFDTTLGNIDLMRIDIAGRFNGKELNIVTNGGLINAMLFTQSKDPKPKKNPVVILCNANADFYEFIYYQNSWIIPFFFKQEIDALVWNYRGFGRSKGFLCPQYLRDDAEFIVRYLRGVGYNKIAAYGHSLGGDVACHIAHKCRLDFLMADRTYGDLKFMSHLKLPRFTSTLMELCTSWDGTPAFDYYSCVAYKVMTNDPKDNIISDAGSLKSLTAQVHVRI
jgi:hypothetical protein